jgi:hypothetical protein
MEHENRVSVPIRIRALCCAWLASTIAPYRPSEKASSGVNSVLATPLTPSVPKYLPKEITPFYQYPIPDHSLLYYTGNLFKDKCFLFRKKQAVHIGIAEED